MPAKSNATDEAQFQQLWDRIQKALIEVNRIVAGETDILREKGAVATKMQWYTAIYNAATTDMKCAEKLYRKLRDWLENDLDTRVIKHVRELVRTSSSTLFQYVSKAYEEFKWSMRFGQTVFQYLDQYYTTKVGVQTIPKLYLASFNKAVYDSCKDQLRPVILVQVQKRRDGFNVDMKALRNAVDIFFTVGTSVAKDAEEASAIFDRDFSIHYVRETEQAYDGAAARQLAGEGGYYSYVQWVNSRYDIERSLVAGLNNDASLSKILGALDRQLLERRFVEVIQHPDAGFGPLLEDNREDALKMMFVTFKRVPSSITLMASEFGKHITGLGAALMKAYTEADPVDGSTMANDKALIESCLSLHVRFEKQISALFENHAAFQLAKKKAIEDFFNVRLYRKEPKPGSTVPEAKETSSGEVLASYCDAVMKREFKDIVDPGAEFERLDHLSQLFSHVKEKDVFQEFYKAKLAKRLLQTSPNEDLEKFFLEKLQRMVGKTFTHKMEGMLHDRESTKNLSDAFANEPQSRSLPAGFECQVLTAAHWPAYKTDSMDPPRSLKLCIDGFTRFYRSKFATRTLKWIHMLAAAQLAMSFPKGPKDVTCSVYQAGILLLLDENGPLTAQVLADRMKLDLAKIIKPNIASMYLSKAFNCLQLQNASAPAKTIGDSDVFSFNMDFVHKMRKFKLPVPVHTTKEGMPTEEDIDSRRKAQIDASIVRIMKSRRTLTAAELTEQVVLQVSRYFTPQPKHIKRQIDDLITRAYLKRSPDDATKFEYLA